MKLLNINKIVVHHSASSIKQKFEDFLRAIDKNHAERLHKEPNSNGNHIAYHFVISRGGDIVRPRPITEVGYHAGHWGTNIRSVGICLQGNFEKEKPSGKQMAALEKLVSELMDDYNIKSKNVILHKHVKATACPGKNLVALQDHFRFGQYERKKDERRLMSIGIIKTPKDVDERPNREEVYAMLVRLHDILISKFNRHGKETS